jgi:O-antigen/teichoic acid export membrane protein
MRSILLRPQASIVNASGLIMVSRGISAVLGYAGTILLVKHLATPVWGQYALVFSLLGLIGVVADLQMGRAVFRALSQDPSPGTVAGSYFVLRGLVGIASYVAAVLFVVCSGYPELVVLATVIAGLDLIAGNLVGAVATFFTSERWFAAVAVSMILGQCVQLGCFVLLASSGRDVSLLYYVVPAVINDVVALGFLLWMIPKIARLKPLIDVGAWGGWLREVAVLSVGGALTVAYTRIDSILLSKWDSVTSVGFYSVGYKFADILGFLALTVSGVVQASLVNSWPGGAEEFHRIFRHAFIVSMCCAAGGALVFCLFAREAIVAAFGSRYGASTRSAQLLVLGEALHFITVLCFVTLQSVGRNRGYPFVVMSGLVLNVALNAVAIPRYSYEGAAVVTVLTELAVASALLLLVTRVPAVGRLPWRSFFVMCCSLIPAALVGRAAATVIIWPVAAVLTGATFLILLHVLRVDGRGGILNLVRNARLANTSALEATPEGEGPPS